MNTGYGKEYAKAVLAGLDMLERANQLDKTADDLLMEIIDLTNTQDLKVMQYLYLLAMARELRAWHEKLFG